MMLLKAAALGLVIVLGISWFVINGVKEAPKLPETWWRPGNEKDVDDRIRPFNVTFDKNVINDLKYRVRNVRNLPPPLKGVAWRYGTPSNFVNKVAKHWANNYDFEKAEKRLNLYPQYKTNIQGLDIHFLHVKPKNPQGKRVVPLLMGHGWPSSYVEHTKTLPLLTTPRPEYDFVFEVIVPSLPGFGFSSAATIPGLSATHIAVVFKNLMLRLGFEKFYVQGGDWAAIIGTDMSSLFPEHVLGLHSTMCIVFTSATILKTGLFNIFPSLIVSKEHAHMMYPAWKQVFWLLEESGYFHILGTKPDTIGVGLSDSPMGMAAFYLEKFSGGTNRAYRDKDDGGFLKEFTLDELIDNLMVYWISNSGVTSGRIYAEYTTKVNLLQGMMGVPVKVPVACAQFPHEIGYQPPYLLKHRYENLIRAKVMPRGGHFSSLEVPDILADDIFSSIAEMEELRKAKKENN